LLVVLVTIREIGGKQNGMPIVQWSKFNNEV
jgi:hypothetical protein